MRWLIYLIMRRTRLVAISLVAISLVLLDQPKQLLRFPGYDGQIPWVRPDPVDVTRIDSR